MGCGSERINISAILSANCSDTTGKMSVTRRSTTASSHLRARMPGNSNRLDMATTYPDPATEPRNPTDVLSDQSGDNNARRTFVPKLRYAYISSCTYTVRRMYFFSMRTADLCVCHVCMVLAKPFCAAIVSVSSMFSIATSVVSIGKSKAQSAYPALCVCSFRCGLTEYRFNRYMALVHRYEIALLRACQLHELPEIVYPPPLCGHRPCKFRGIRDAAALRVSVDYPYIFLATLAPVPNLESGLSRRRLPPPWVGIGAGCGSVVTLSRPYPHTRT